ncbi:EAL domain-containing protein [Vibrio hyugaensis]
MLVVEGVESRHQVQTLKELGVNFMQGYFFAKPAPICELTVV